MHSEKRAKKVENKLSKRTSTKKVFIFILEGWADKQALEGILKRLYRNRNILPVVMYGDITSDLDIDVSCIEKKISEQISSKLKEEKFRISDVVNIFQICDTDGAFVPDTAIIQGNEKRFVYSPTTISAPDITLATERNKHKTDAIVSLLKKTTLMNIPYKLFYMSCNLDHVLFDIQNLDDNLKTKKADEFFDKYRDCPLDFVSFIKRCSNGVPENFNDSWKYIMDGLHSLERHNNFFIFFIEHPFFAM